MSPQPAQQEQKSALQLWYVPRPQPPLTDSISPASIGRVTLEDVVIINGEDGIHAIRGVLGNVGYLGKLERHHLLVKLMITPPGPPYETSLSGLIRANRHPDYPTGLLLAPMRHRRGAPYMVEETESSWQWQRLVFPLTAVRHKAAIQKQFNSVGTMPAESIDKFVIAAASAYYGATPMSETTPKVDSLLFYRQIKASG